MAIPKRDCPNCGSPKFKDTISREHCPACGMECNYYTGISNDVYDKWMARLHAAQEAAAEADQKRRYGDEGD